MKIGSNRESNNDKKLTSSESDKREGDAPMKKRTDKSDNLAIQHDKSRMLSKEHSDEKLAITLLIVGAGLIAPRF